MNERRAAILFLMPALAVILLFFLLPVCASLLLSLTDFDLYALADIHNIRLVALQDLERVTDRVGTGRTRRRRSGARSAGVEADRDLTGREVHDEARDEERRDMMRWQAARGRFF